MVENGSDISKILIAYDGSGYAHGVLGELRSSGLPKKAQIIIISVCEIWLPTGAPRIIIGQLNREEKACFQKHREQIDRNMTETMANVRLAQEELLSFFPDWSVEVEVICGSPAREILEKASKFRPDLIVIGERGLSSDEDTGLGSTSQIVLAEARCTVRISRFRSPPSDSNLTVIVGFDGSPGSITAIRKVASRPWKTKPTIRLVTVTDPFTLLKPGRVFQPIEGMVEGRMEGETKWANNLARDAIHLLREVSYPATLHIYSGNPQMVLISAATKWNADAIFLGATSETSLSEKYSLGCVALAIANRAPCSVEVVR
ncbi:MAG TPA: universal stress protein [Pyrinomonadaceae bacterium]|nr:universal stress protein [Pyrinomonadaceae bacterium]